jgi:hypothetical protein
MRIGVPGDPEQLEAHAAILAPWRAAGSTLS